jgi:hypothetical protein
MLQGPCVDILRDSPYTPPHLMYAQACLKVSKTEVVTIRAVKCPDPLEFHRTVTRKGDDCGFGVL